MDSPSSAVLPIPRLRLSRNAHLYETAGAGPSRSRFQDTLPAPVDFDHNSEVNGNYYDDDQFPTPRITSNATLITTETPAERLRAVLARVPTSAKSTPMPHSPARTPSELDSDFEPPDGYPATPSIARESLKAIFSRAVREPGDTPQKESNRLKRRNSIDVSEVEASPRVKERAKNKGKRKSLSDEEVEKPAQPSEASFRSSQAATFDILRERLTNSHTQIKDQRLTDFLYNQSIPDHISHDTATILRDLNTSHSPPAATSKHQESLHMSTNSQFQFESNLLEQDSEMQRAIEGFDSYEDSGPSLRPVLFPPSRAGATQSQSQKQRSPASPQALQGPHRHGESSQLHEHEREWSKLKTPVRPHTPELKHQPSHNRFSRSSSPMVTAVNSGTLSRRNSTTSLRSFDDDSSKGSSFGSQAEYRERINELERERNIEREREWNKRNPTLSRPRSSLSLNSSTGLERVRTRSLNQVSRPESAQSHPSVLAPHRHDSLSNSSRASSPAGSFKSNHSGKEESEGEEATHQRERNWNAPRPKWTPHTPASPPVSSRIHSSTSKRVPAESLKMSRTTRTESPPPPDKAAAESTSLRINGPGSVKKKPATGTASPLPQERPIISPKSSRTPAQISRPQSPLPIPSTKGKEKENEGPQIKSPVVQSKSQTPDLASMSGSHFGYTFMRNRTTLPPIDFEKSPERPTPSHARRLSSPSPTSGARPSDGSSGSVEQSQSPGQSPRKEKTTITAMNENTTTHGEPPHMSSRSLEYDPQSLMPSSFSKNRETDDNSEGSGSLSQERTPTIRTVRPPLLETPEYTPPRSPSPPFHQSTPINDESRLQKAIGSKYTTPMPINTNATSTSLQEISPPPSPPVDQPHQIPQSSKESPFSTPPRRSSFSVSRAEFQTPSPPKGLPELPGPPSSSEGDQDRQEAEGERTPIRDLHVNLTAMKTPRPPGAWASTPGPQPYHKYPLQDDYDNDQAQTPTRDLHSDFSTIKTPKAPGAWMSTPAPPSRESHSQPHSYAGDTDTECESGLATPVASLSRASSLPLPTQTPAPPGAWTATPGVRKSILKVRFDTQAPRTDQSLSGDAIESSNDFVDGIANASWRIDNTSVDTAASDAKSAQPEARSRTPEPPSTPVSPSRSPRRSPPRKSPSIRVLDAFGREQGSEKKPNKDLGNSRNKSGIRVVDAMGRNIENSVEQSALGDTDGKEFPPLKHGEALVRVRQGLSDLARGLEEINRADHSTPVDYARLRELNDESRNSRAMRERITQTLSAAEDDLHSRLGSMRKHMKHKFLPAVINRGLSGFRMTPWIFWGALFLQLLLILFMYRVSVMRARNSFLTTYYDPFYPDLHLYVSKPDSIRHSMLSSATPWLSIPDTLRREGWKASAGKIQDNFSIMISEWQRLIWEAWGDKAVQSNVPWPPT